MAIYEHKITCPSEDCSEEFYVQLQANRPTSTRRRVIANSCRSCGKKVTYKESETTVPGDRVVHAYADDEHQSYLLDGELGSGEFIEQ